MKNWQFNVLFVLGIVGAVVMLFGESLGLTVRSEVVTVFGTLLAFLYTQKRENKRHDEDENPDKKKEGK